MIYAAVGPAIAGLICLRYAVRMVGAVVEGYRNGDKGIIRFAAPYIASEVLLAAIGFGAAAWIGTR